MNFFEPIDQYCERAGHGLLEEPLNLFTNLSFIIAGLLILKSIKKFKAEDLKPGSLLLGRLIIAIGLGSALFHSFANFWSMWADILPIGIFVLAYLWLFLRHVANLGVQPSLLFFIGFFTLSFFCTQLADPTAANGGEAYFGTWIALFGIACFYAGRGQTQAFYAVGSAALIFSVSLFFRTIDQRICASWPMGTHLMWHVLNGVVLFLVTRAYVTAPGRP